MRLRVHNVGGRYRKYFGQKIWKWFHQGGQREDVMILPQLNLQELVMKISTDVTRSRTRASGRLHEQRNEARAPWKPGKFVIFRAIFIKVYAVWIWLINDCNILNSWNSGIRRYNPTLYKVMYRWRRTGCCVACHSVWEEGSRCADVPSSELYQVYK